MNSGNRVGNTRLVYRSTPYHVAFVGQWSPNTPMRVQAPLLSYVCSMPSRFFDGIVFFAVEKSEHWVEAQSSGESMLVYEAEGAELALSRSSLCIRAARNSRKCFRRVWLCSLDFWQFWMRMRVLATVAFALPMELSRSSCNARESCKKEPAVFMGFMPFAKKQKTVPTK